jgi:hypothetical protein
MQQNHPLVVGAESTRGAFSSTQQKAKCCSLHDVERVYTRVREPWTNITHVSLMLAAHMLQSAHCGKSASNLLLEAVAITQCHARVHRYC